MREFKSITHCKGVLHIETELGIVNIHAGLHDAQGRAVEAILISPDDRCIGEPKVIRRGSRLIRLKTDRVKS